MVNSPSPEQIEVGNSPEIEVILKRALEGGNLQLTGDFDRAGRFVLIETPIMQPGVCGICGKGDPGAGYVWFGCSFEYYGNLYFCMECALAMARTCGAINPETAAEYRKEIEDLTEETIQLRKKLADYQELGNVINRLNGNSPDPVIDFAGRTHHVPYVEPIESTVSDADDPESKFSDAEVLHGSEETGSGNDADIIEPDNVISEPIIEQGSDGVSSPAVYDPVPEFLRGI